MRSAARFLGAALIALLIALVCPGSAYLQLYSGGYLSLTPNNLPTGTADYSVMMKIRIQSYSTTTGLGTSPRFWDSRYGVTLRNNFPDDGVSFSCAASGGFAWFLKRTGTGNSPLPQILLFPSPTASCDLDAPAGPGPGTLPLNTDLSMWFSMKASTGYGSLYSAYLASKHADYQSTLMTYAGATTASQNVLLLFGFNVAVYEITIWNSAYVDTSPVPWGPILQPYTAVPNNFGNGLQYRYDFTTQTAGETVVYSTTTTTTDWITVNGTEAVDYVWVPAPAPWAPTTSPPPGTSSSPSPPGPTTPSPTDTSPPPNPSLSPSPSPSATTPPPTTGSSCIGVPPILGAVCENGLWVVNGNVTVIDITVGSGSPIAVNGSINIGGTTTVILDPSQPNTPITATGDVIVDGEVVIILSGNPTAPIAVPIANAGGVVVGGFTDGQLQLANGKCAKAKYSPTIDASGTLGALITPDNSKCGSNKFPLAAIAGIVVGVILLMAFVAIVLLFVYRKRTGRDSVVFQATNNERKMSMWR